MGGAVGASESKSANPMVRVPAIAAMVLGTLSVLAWLGGLAALFAGLDNDENGLVATAALVGIVVLAAVATAPFKSAGRVVTITGAVLYVGIWLYLRVGFDRMMPDAILTALTGVFFIAPLVTGMGAIVVGARGAKR